MGAMIEETEIMLESASRMGVTCIFCGLPTPVRGLNGSLISIVRCEVCGKEAPYPAREIAEFKQGAHGSFFANDRETELWESFRAKGGVHATT